jgi:hypothetical protein
MWRCVAVSAFPNASRERTVYISKGSADPSTFPSIDTVLYITALERHPPNVLMQTYEL